MFSAHSFSVVFFLYAVHSFYMVCFLYLAHSAILVSLKTLVRLWHMGLLHFSARLSILDSSTILARSCLLVFLAIKAHFYTLDFF